MAGELTPRSDSDDAVWERVKALMPACDCCGARLQPGGLPRAGRYLLVCTSCSFIGEVDPDWVARVVEQARAEVDASAN